MRRQLALVMSRVPLVMGSLYVTIIVAFGGWLCHPEDSSQCPVVAAGFTSPLFAQTRTSNTALIAPSGEGAPDNNSVNVQGLPVFLLSQQVAEGQPGAGSFYRQFNHSDGDQNNCTEDTLFATLGLLTTSQRYPDPNVDSAVHAARPALLGGITAEGLVRRERLSQGGTETWRHKLGCRSVLVELGDSDDGPGVSDSRRLGASSDLAV